jgi:hypothetical protein
VTQATGGTTDIVVINNKAYARHTFTTSETFTVTDSGEIEYLIVGGGGSGGTRHAGGGGAGGFLTGTTSVTPQTYTITVGAGGVANFSGSTNFLGVNGSNSSAISLVALGGGGGGTAGNDGVAGGSGGGAGENINRIGGAGQQPGSASGGFGNAGGNGNTSGTWNGGGGGGGAGAVGQNAQVRANPAGGNGGAGREWPLGSGNFYAGGGGGSTYGNSTSTTAAVKNHGAGGIGGGGAGGTDNGVAGTVNTGGGGGGGSSNGGGSGRGGNGGSGIIILLYELEVTPVVATTDQSQVELNKYVQNPGIVPVSATGGFGSYTFGIIPPLPKGLSFNSLNGTITGQPQEIVNRTFQITVFDSLGNNDSSSFTLITSLIPETIAELTGGLETTSSGDGLLFKTHVYTSSGALEVITPGTVEYLIVAGGGGGGSDMGGGGGGGGYLAGLTDISGGNYTVIVGAGGTGAPPGTDQVRGNSGNSSGIAPLNFKGHSYSFDGAGDNLRIAYDLGHHLSGDFTIELWFYAVSFGSMIVNFGGGLNIAWASWELVAQPDGINFAASSANNGYDIGSETGATGRIGTVQLGTWNHLAVTRSGNVYRGFVNGIQGYTQTTALTPFNPNARGLAIGSNYSGTGGWGVPANVSSSVNGFISNLRIVKGTAVYTANFEPPTEPLSAITNTTLLTAQDLSFVDNSSLNLTLIASGNTQASNWQPFTNLALGAIGGGGGASDHTAPVAASAAAFGGSGGGASGQNANRGLGISGQGFAGGTTSGQWFPGGGGGAGGVGLTSPANGGAGRPNSILGIDYFWAGGGGGSGYTGISGNGGSGGGGGGAPRVSGGGFGDASGLNPAQNAEEGTLVAQTNRRGGAGGVNTGGGGGGGSHFNLTNDGGAGGSGIVVIRYPIGIAPVQAITVLPINKFTKFDTINFRPVEPLGGIDHVYSISSALPTGLQFNTSTGFITGTPTQEVRDRQYTVTITAGSFEGTTSSFSTFLLSTSLSYLTSIDLVVNSTLSLQVRNSIPDDERTNSEIIPTNTSILVDNLAAEKNLRQGVVNSVRVYSGDTNFSSSSQLTSTFIDHSFENYVSLNNNLKSVYGTAVVGVTDFVIDEEEYTTPGTYTWTVPQGVTSISAVAVGGGGGGSQQSSGGTGGVGGSLSFVNNISVIPGDEYTVVVGSGGTTGGSSGGNTGGTTYLMNNATKQVLLLAPGGLGGDGIYWKNNNINVDMFNLGQIIDLSAEDPQSRTITYSISSGDLPPGFSLNSNTGVLSYVSQSITEDITYPTFTLSAAVSGQVITRIVIIRVNALLIGFTEEFPATSASELQSLGITTNGSYFITINSQAVQCHVNFTLPGGPYILAMTTSNTGSDYGFDSAVWTNTTGGSTLALDPTANANQVSYAFYHLATSRTGLSLHENIVDYMHYINHALFTARALANGAVAVPTAVTPNNTSNPGGTLIVTDQAARAQGWFDAVTAAGFSPMTVGTTYYRYGWQHGTPDPVQFGYVRFGWSADIDSSDSRDRAIGIGLKNNGGGPVGTYTVSSGYFDYSTGAKNNIRSWLWIKN